MSGFAASGRLAGGQAVLGRDEKGARGVGARLAAAAGAKSHSAGICTLHRLPVKECPPPIPVAAVKVNSLGKWKTALQMIAMSALLLLRNADHVLGSDVRGEPGRRSTLYFIILFKWRKQLMHGAVCSVWAATCGVSQGAFPPGKRRVHPVHAVVCRVLQPGHASLQCMLWCAAQRIAAWACA